MIIEGNEANYISNVLTGALNRGARYVCLNTGLLDRYFRAEMMQFFQDKSEALQYSHSKRVTDKEYLETLPVLPLQQQLHRKIELQQITRTSGRELTDISIDTGNIHYLERARREVFTEEIARNLQDNGMIIHLKQLQENIDKDLLAFSITGIRREQGVDQSCTINIEQNENRAFQIKGISLQILLNQENENYMKSILLGGTVQKEDAFEIKNMMQGEKEKGNNFVSFPLDKDGLKKEDFTPFKTAIAALEHADTKANEKQSLGVLSIRIVEKEIDSILENRKEQTQEQKPDNKRSRDSDLSL